MQQQEEQQLTKEQVLDHGSVELIDYMGNDYRILQAARVSTGADAIKGDVKDRALIRYLYMNQHSSPFEQVVFTWKLKTPLFIANQWVRHRTGKFNFASARYQKLPTIDYKPDEFRIQDTKNKQNSFTGFTPEQNAQLISMYQDLLDHSNEVYDYMTEQGVAREQARGIMPMARYTEFFFTIDLRNLFHFLELRLHEHAQYEIRVFAESILRQLEDIPELKWSVEVFNEMRLLKYEFQKLVTNYRNDTEELLVQMKLMNKAFQK